MGALDELFPTAEKLRRDLEHADYIEANRKLRQDRLNNGRGGDGDYQAAIGDLTIQLAEAKEEMLHVGHENDCLQSQVDELKRQMEKELAMVRDALQDACNYIGEHVTGGKSFAEILRIEGEIK
jgi:uncharacterized coiled-coil DUF342 family protein